MQRCKHRTLNENRPEPWFEIDAETLIQIANNKGVTIPCIRSETCETCIKENPSSFALTKWVETGIENKNKAVDILYEWLSTGVEIPPFKYDYPFIKIEKNAKYEWTNEFFDLVIYIGNEENDDVWIRYCINLTNNKFECCDEYTYAEFYAGIYYISIEWILSQQTIPNNINYRVSWDCYDKDEFDKTCKNCKHYFSFWVLRTSHDGRIKNILGCVSCGINKNTEYTNCDRCNNKCELNICDYQTIRSLCAQCNFYINWNEIVYLNVGFNDKNEIKKFGGIWDMKHKLWYVEKFNINYEIILSKWNKKWL